MAGGGKAVDMKAHASAFFLEPLRKDISLFRLDK